MADFTQTINNSLNTFGPAPSTKWGTGTPYTMTWGTTLWGEGTEDLMCAVEVGPISNSQSFSDAYYKDVTKQMGIDLTFLSETISEGLKDGSGWDYVFSKPSTEAEDRNPVTWSEPSDPSTSWSEDGDESTSWSEQ